MRKGILLVAFGSSRQEAHLSLRQFEERVRNRFPDIPVRWGFTSGIVRGKLADKGKKTDSSDKALQKMLFERYTHVAVQSLHVITGKEYEALATDVDQFAERTNGFDSVSLGRPLIGGEEDVPRVVEAILSHLPPDRKAQEAVVLMGHGTWHAGDSLYDTLYDAMQTKDPNIFVATMDGRLTIESVRDELLARGMNKAWLVPLLALPGRHVQKDMCGSGPDSWVSILDAAGISTSCVVRGTAEYDGYADIWLDHLAEALNQL
ncbi:sirohydrochlorin cobaltochelatase [Desulfovibrio ferrophilus]|uniref:Cobalt chelatase family protein n=1 Tax=Desulfovibrio ferrophilus TaxID=241368 RepID=A0A2Z6AXR4_9BACT|nr:sirohydrochlorin cobaltochelatase [Desulfovibrio ferrophilus]BBD08029.1 cobalt chelatase family protein [Desulfovibrio ferrophilus]